MKISRKKALKNMAGLSALGFIGFPEFGHSQSIKEMKGKINHSVCRWPYGKNTLEELCEAAKEIGISSIELLNPDEWPIVQKYGLTCAMANCVPLSLTDGFNDPKLHEQLKKDYFDLIPKVADAGLKNIICFSGNRNGMPDDQGMENCAIGLEPVVKKAQEYGLTICMELLNSKVNHPDYQCDHTEWGAGLCEKLGLENFKLLYDIYHMQIMEGDIIATIQKYHPYIAHYHTGGVPGRNEIDETQELNYKAIMEAIVATGFTGYVAQEFIPKNEDVFASLAQGVRICDV
ncbi:hydroxypyruvate isomerase family protein [Marinoscillum luteum]|uniref:Hydroxypyruvate isomerase family protein n=1 Tax=Marinoscillum luteum TaxID=861051 RepID=A0ABW7NB22_9BACT